MKSLKYLYRIGRGPSSSHTMGPEKAIKHIKKKYSDIKSAKVILYGSLAFTGKGHLTDKIIKETFLPIPCEIIFDYKNRVEFPNTFDVELTLKNEKIIKERIYSIGGGAIHFENEKEDFEKEIYQEKNFNEIKKYLEEKNVSLSQYVYIHEGDEIKTHLKKVWETMVNEINNGLKNVGDLPGNLHIKRRASSFKTANKHETNEAKTFRLLSSYAFAASEENASGGIVVTAPTCGSAGVVPSVLYFCKKKYHYNDDDIVDALSVAGVIGNIVKQNASISGAEAGCQAEIGTACSMAAAALSYLKGFDIDQIECAAEAAMEHCLGLTCDPVDGYVQIPCIERNAIAAIKAISAVTLAQYASNTHRVSFDTIVNTMFETGKDLKNKYRETSKGGLAVHLKNK